MSRSDHEIELLEDIMRYQALTERSDEMEKDIPPKRTRVKRVTKSPRAKGKGKKPQLQKPAWAARGKQDLAAAPKMEQKDVKRPSEPVARRLRRRKAEPEEKPKPKQIKIKLPQLRATTFEQRVTTENSYPELVRLVKHNTDNLDFAMQLGLLPKNIDAERRRFEIEFAADKLQLCKSSLSEDIDLFFRLISTMNVPLI